jgi:hypothetical protein
LRIARSPSPPTAPTGTGDARIAALTNQLTQAAQGRAISAVSVRCSIARHPADLSRRKRLADPPVPAACDTVLSNTPLQRPQKLRPASLRDGRTKRWPLRSGFALARTEDRCVSRPRHERLPRRVAPVVVRSREGPLTEPAAAAQSLPARTGLHAQRRRCESASGHGQYSGSALASRRPRVGAVGVLQFQGRANRGSGCQGIDLAERGGSSAREDRQTVLFLSSSFALRTCSNSPLSFADKKGTAPHGIHTNKQANPSCNRSSPWEMRSKPGPFMGESALPAHIRTRGL